MGAEVVVNRRVKFYSAAKLAYSDIALNQIFAANWAAIIFGGLARPHALEPHAADHDGMGLQVVVVRLAVVVEDTRLSILGLRSGNRS